MNRKIFLVDLGLTDYKEAYAVQKKRFEEIKAIKLKNKQENTRLITPNYFFFTEHPHVYTLGKSGKKEHLLLPEQELKKKQAVFIPTDRGGDITYHGPGQIVGYPVIDLDNFGMDIIRYIRLLEEVIIRVIGEYGLKGERSEGETGVWLDAKTPKARKICAIGVRTSRYVTMHGFALNVTTDLRYFDNIIPCGIKNKGVTSLDKELGYAPRMQEVKKHIIRHFSEVFGAEFEEKTALDPPIS